MLVLLTAAFVLVFEICSKGRVVPNLPGHEVQTGQETECQAGADHQRQQGMHEIVCTHRPCFTLTDVQGQITTKEQALYEGGSELKRMKSLAETELQDNKLEFKRRRGDPVSHAFVSVTSSG